MRIASSMRDHGVWFGNRGYRLATEIEQASFFLEKLHFKTGSFGIKTKTPLIDPSVDWRLIGGGLGKGEGFLGPPLFSFTNIMKKTRLYLLAHYGEGRRSSLPDGAWDRFRKCPDWQGFGVGLGVVLFLDGVGKAKGGVVC